MRRLAYPLVSAFMLVACVGEVVETDGDDGDEMEDPPVVCDQPRSYAGFGGPLETDRPAIAAGSDRMRIKPFAALAAEYRRALGLSTFETAAYAATFGRPPARWYSEPTASANTIYAAFALAYAGCTQKTAAGGVFATPPSTQIADPVCRDFARAAWQREATDSEVAACATYAIEKTHAADPPAKRWAYTCAAVLSASRFLAY